MGRWGLQREVLESWACFSLSPWESGSMDTSPKERIPFTLPRQQLELLHILGALFYWRLQLTPAWCCKQVVGSLLLHVSISIAGAFNPHQQFRELRFT